MDMPKTWAYQLPRLKITEDLSVSVNAVPQSLRYLICLALVQKRHNNAGLDTVLSPCCVVTSTVRLAA
jgi:hypothetical protein